MGSLLPVARGERQEERVKDFPIVRTARSRRPAGSIVRTLLPPPRSNRLISPGANFVIGGELAELVGEARTLIMLSRH